MGPSDGATRAGRVWLRAAVIAGGCVVGACGGAPPPPARVKLDLPRAPATARRCAVSDGTARLLQSLPRKVVIDAYVTRGQPKAEAFVRDLRELLEAYKEAGQGKLDFHLVELGVGDADDDARREARDAGLSPVPFESGKDRRMTEGYLGLVFTCGADKDTIPLLSPDKDQGLELWITGKIRELSDKAAGIKHRIGLLTGDGEMKLGEPNLVPSQTGKPSMQDVIERNFPSFAFVDVDLAGGDKAVDDSLEGLLVLQPGKDIPERALRRIDEFVMKGKSLVVFASSVNVEAHDATMHATLDAHGLDELLGGYGIELRKDVVLDFKGSFSVTMLTQSGLQSMHFPQVLQVDEVSPEDEHQHLLDTGFLPFFRMEQVVLPFASSLRLHPDRQPATVTMKVVAHSTRAVARKTDDSVDLSPFHPWQPASESPPLDLAAYVQGNLRTAFPSGSAAAGSAEVPKGRSARVFVLSASQFTANPFARAGNAPESLSSTKDPAGDEKLLQIAGPYADLQRGAVPLLYSIMVTKNTLDWMTGDPSLDALGGRAMCARPAP